MVRLSIDHILIVKLYEKKGKGKNQQPCPIFSYNIGNLLLNAFAHVLNSYIM